MLRPGGQVFPRAPDKIPIAALRGRYVPPTRRLKQRTTDMHNTLSGRSAARRWLAGLLAAVAVSAGQAAEYFDAYGLRPDSPAVDLGTQPLGYPSGVISAVMHRDRILRRELAALDQPLSAHPFRRGADMLGLLAERRLDAALLGDMPTILGAAEGRLWIVGLVKQTATAIVASGIHEVAGLAGKRVAYVPVSSAHHTLLQGLASAGLQESDVRLVAMGVDAMPAALQRGDIDAFAAWEPAPSTALSQGGGVQIVFRGRSSDYFVVEKAFAQRSPQAAEALVAGYVRAIEWMRRSRRNLDKAAQWALADARDFGGKAPEVTPEQIGAITRREILNIPSAPVIINNSKGPPPLRKEFEFLRSQNKLPAAGTWENVGGAFQTDLLPRVIADPQRHRLQTFDYED